MPKFLFASIVSRINLAIGLRLLALSLGLLISVAAGHAENILRIPYSSDIGTLDPDNGFEVAGLTALDSVYEGLVKYEASSTKIVGSLAKSWEMSGDGLAYTFHLVHGVKFHDGTILNADAVVTSFKRRRDGGFVQNYTLANVADIAAPDSSTVVITLRHAQPSFMDSLAGPWGPKIISSAVLSDHAKGDFATGWLTDHAVGTGPFKLAEFKRGERYVLERNEDYWGARPFFGKVEFPVIPDIGQQILKLKAGEIDAVPANFPFAQLGSLPADLEITSAPSMTQYEAFIKPGSPLDDAEVRKAVLTAINPNLWAKDAFGQYAHVSKSLYPNIMLNPGQPVQFPTDIEAAKSAIARHGSVILTIGLYSANPSYGRIADLMIAGLSLIGVQATSHIMPPGAAYAMKGDPAAPDMLLIIASPDAAHPDNQAKAFFTKDAPLNLYGSTLPEADAVVAEGASAVDLAARNAFYEKAGQMYFDAGHFIPLVDVDDVVVHRKGLKDLGLRPVFPRGSIDYSRVRR
ncbi:peptide/nickel transport system substrate-binding protein [Rhizobium sp. BK529]|uniref:ABC transporter substrate-binding protein n=1 Tax=unclassified Rhizobium TaxID=2613769 RepID=UPI00104C1A1F|nr:MULTISPECIES: ABC transporter substrate-binding protein [unclassified Rhizobium]MBB3594247.1 peptide/nickel transport system substrate-binding protein [Rhizobium sp. BK529]TCS01703.1 peptide/nickel transport system substrate-binding protein [Rhizobium sp. BK418]